MGTGILESTLPPLPASQKTWFKRFIGKDKLKVTLTGKMFESDIEKETWANCDGWIRAYLSRYCKVVFDDNQGVQFSMPTGYTLVLASDSVIEKIYESQNKQEVKLHLPYDGSEMLDCYNKISHFGG